MQARRGFIKGTTMFIRADCRSARYPTDPDDMALEALVDASGQNLLSLVDAPVHDIDFERLATGSWRLRIDTTELEVGQYRVLIRGVFGDDEVLVDSAFVILAA